MDRASFLAAVLEACHSPDWDEAARDRFDEKAMSYNPGALNEWADWYLSQGGDLTVGIRECAEALKYPVMRSLEIEGMMSAKAANQFSGKFAADKHR